MLAFGAYARATMSVNGRVLAIFRVHFAVALFHPPFTFNSIILIVRISKTPVIESGFSAVICLAGSANCVGIGFEFERCWLNGEHTETIQYFCKIKKVC